MTSHHSLETHEKVVELADELARSAAVLVAVLAAFLAVTSFLANRAATDVVTGETQGADLASRLEANAVKTDIAESSAKILEVLAVGAPGARKAARHAEALDAKVEQRFEPVDERLDEEIEHHHHEREHAEDRHLLFELSTIGFEVGIVVAGISIIARRRWLLTTGGLAGIAGLGVLVAGLLV